MDNFGILTWKVEDRSNSVDFMDITISIEDTRLVTKIYEKPENPYMYLPSASCHTAGIIKGTVIGMIYRYYVLTTYRTDYLAQVEIFFHRLCRRGYRPRFLRTIFDEALYRAPIINDKQNKENPKESNEALCNIRIPFHPSTPSRREI